MLQSDPKEGKTVLPYHHQNYAWFDRNTTMWWIMNLFWPWHIKHHGYVNDILFIDNCTTYDSDMYSLPGRLTIKYIAMDVTNIHKPEDIGMIASLKVG